MNNTPKHSVTCVPAQVKAEPAKYDQTLADLVQHRNTVRYEIAKTRALLHSLEQTRFSNEVDTMYYLVQEGLYEYMKVDWEKLAKSVGNR